jgi:hypothetical protein
MLQEFCKNGIPSIFTLWKGVTQYPLDRLVRPHTSCAPYENKKNLSPTKNGTFCWKSI